MALKDIVSITGKSGLYRIVSRTNSGIIVESMDERKSKMKINTNFQVAVLEEITIYTQDGSDLHLKDVFKNIYNRDGEKTAVSHKAKPNELREYFEEVAPDHDPDKVYPSDIKKIVQWYNILSGHNMLDLEDEEEEEEKETGNDGEEGKAGKEEEQDESNEEHSGKN